MKKTKQTTQPSKKKHLKHTKSKTILLLILYITPHLQTYQEEETYYDPYIQTETTIQKDEETTRHQNETLQYLIKASVIILFGISIYKIIDKILDPEPPDITSNYLNQKELQDALVSFGKRIEEELNTYVENSQTQQKKIKYVQDELYRFYQKNQLKKTHEKKRATQLETEEKPKANQYTQHNTYYIFTPKTKNLKKEIENQLDERYKYEQRLNEQQRKNKKTRETLKSDFYNLNSQLNNYKEPPSPISSISSENKTNYETISPLIPINENTHPDTLENNNSSKVKNEHTSEHVQNEKDQRNSSPITPVQSLELGSEYLSNLERKKTNESTPNMEKSEDSPLTISNQSSSPLTPKSEDGLYGIKQVLNDSSKFGHVGLPSLRSYENLAISKVLEA